MVSSVMHDFLRKTLRRIFCLYGLFLTVAPYFTWKCAQELGFWDWLGWGEVAPATRSLLWGYLDLHQSVSARSAVAGVQSSSRL